MMDDHQVPTDDDDDDDIVLCIDDDGIILCDDDDDDHHHHHVKKKDTTTTTGVLDHSNDHYHDDDDGVDVHQTTTTVTSSTSSEVATPPTATSDCSTSCCSYHYHHRVGDNVYIRDEQMGWLPGIILAIQQQQQQQEEQNEQQQEQTLSSTKTTTVNHNNNEDRSSSRSSSLMVKVQIQLPEDWDTTTTTTTTCHPTTTTTHSTITCSNHEKENETEETQDEDVDEEKKEEEYYYGDDPKERSLHHPTMMKQQEQQHYDDGCSNSGYNELNHSIRWIQCKDYLNHQLPKCYQQRKGTLLLLNDDPSMSMSMSEAALLYHLKEQCVFTTTKKQQKQQQPHQYYTRITNNLLVTMKNSTSAISKSTTEEKRNSNSHPVGVLLGGVQVPPQSSPQEEEQQQQLQTKRKQKVEMEIIEQEQGMTTQLMNQDPMNHHDNSSNTTITTTTTATNNNNNTNYHHSVQSLFTFWKEKSTTTTTTTEKSSTNGMILLPPTKRYVPEKDPMNHTTTEEQEQQQQDDDEKNKEANVHPTIDHHNNNCDDSPPPPLEMDGILSTDSTCIQEEREVQHHHHDQPIFDICSFVYENIMGTITTPTITNKGKTTTTTTQKQDGTTTSHNTNKKMMRRNKNQTILITGETNTGKTYNSRLIVQTLLSMNVGTSKNNNNKNTKENELIMATTSTTTSPINNNKKIIMQEQLHESVLIQRRIQAGRIILDAFGNARTKQNNDSSRFASVLQLHYDKVDDDDVIIASKNNSNNHSHNNNATTTNATITKNKYTSGEIQEKSDRSMELIGGTIHTYFLETNRVSKLLSTSVGGGEKDGSGYIMDRNFQIFYQLFLFPKQWKEMYLGPQWMDLVGSDFCILNNTNNNNNNNFRQVWNACQLDDDGYIIQSTNQVWNALETLFQDDTTIIHEIIHCLKIILRLGNIVFEVNKNGDVTIQSHETLLLLASELGVQWEELLEVLTKKVVTPDSSSASIPLVPNSTTTSGTDLDPISPSPVKVSYSIDDANEARNSTIGLIYKCLFKYIVHQINTLIAPSPPPPFDIMNSPTTKIVSIVDTIGYESFTYNRFEQFRMNYISERIQQKFIHDIFGRYKYEFDKEGIDVHELKDIDNTSIIDLLEGSSLGIIPILNKHTQGLRSTSEMFVSEVKLKNKNHSKMDFEQNQGATEFIVRHFAGNVLYDGNEFVQKNKNLIHDKIILTFSKCSNSVLSKELKSHVPTKISPTKMSRRFEMENVGSELQDLAKAIDNSETHYVRCLKSSDDINSKGKVNQLSLLRQIRYSGLVAGLELSNQVYPDEMAYEEVHNTFSCLLSTECKISMKGMDLHDKVQLMLTIIFSPLIETYGDSEFTMPFACGKSRVFFRSGALKNVKTRQEERVNTTTIVLQKWIRGTLVKGHYKNIINAITIMQAMHRKRQEEGTYIRLRAAASKIQNFGKMIIIQNQVTRTKKYRVAALSIQHWIRKIKRNIERQRLEKAATAISRWRRSQKERNADFKARWGTMMIPIYLNALVKLKCYDSKKKQKLIKTINNSNCQFTHKVPFTLLVERFDCLIPPTNQMFMKGMVDEDKTYLILSTLYKPFMEAYMERTKCITLPYECGKTHVYFRPGSLEILEILRREHYTVAVIRLQSWARKIATTRRYKVIRNALLRFQHNYHRRNATRNVCSYLRTLSDLGYQNQRYKSILAKAVANTSKPFPYILTCDVAKNRFATLIPSNQREKVVGMNSVEEANYILRALLSPFALNNNYVPFICKDEGVYLRTGSLEILEIMRKEAMSKSSTKIQSFIRMKQETQKIERKTKLITKIQSFIRMQQATTKFERKSILIRRSQSLVRSVLERRRFLLRKKSSIVLQIFLRKVHGRKEENLRKRRARDKIESVLRGFIHLRRKKSNCAVLISSWASSCILRQTQRKRDGETDLTTESIFLVQPNELESDSMVLPSGVVSSNERGYTKEINIRGPETQDIVIPLVNDYSELSCVSDKRNETEFLENVSDFSFIESDYLSPRNEHVLEAQESEQALICTDAIAIEETMRGLKVPAKEDIIVYEDAKDGRNKSDVCKNEGDLPCSTSFVNEGVEIMDEESNLLSSRLRTQTPQIERTKVACPTTQEIACMAQNTLESNTMHCLPKTLKSEMGCNESSVSTKQKSNLLVELYEDKVNINVSQKCSQLKVLSKESHVDHGISRDEKLYEEQVASLQDSIKQVTAEAEMHNLEVVAEYEERLSAYEAEVLHLQRNIELLEGETSTLKKRLIVAQESYEKNVKSLKQTLQSSEASHRSLLAQVMNSVEKSKVENARAIEAVKNDRDAHIRQLESTIESLQNRQETDTMDTTSFVHEESTIQEAKRLAKKLEKIVSPQHIIKVTEKHRDVPKTLSNVVEDKISFKARNIVGRMERMIVAACTSPQQKINVINAEATDDTRHLEQQLVHAYEEIEMMQREINAYRNIIDVDTQGRYY